MSRPENISANVASSIPLKAALRSGTGRSPIPTPSRLVAPRTGCDDASERDLCVAQIGSATTSWNRVNVRSTAGAAALATPRPVPLNGSVRR